jgi:hypothetical protein
MTDRRCSATPAPKACLSARRLAVRAETTCDPGQYSGSGTADKRDNAANPALFDEYQSKENAKHTLRHRRLVGRRPGSGGNNGARRGTRPSAPNDQRTASTYIFGAICPSDGKGAALVLPRCDTEAMNLHLAEIATEIAPGKHAVLLLDQAGWHLSNRLVVPATITLMPLPPKCPELNPVENVWQFIRENWLSNRAPLRQFLIARCPSAGCEPDPRGEDNANHTVSVVRSILAPEAHRVLQRLSFITRRNTESAEHGGNRNRCAARSMSGSPNR